MSEQQNLQAYVQAQANTVAPGETPVSQPTVAPSTNRRELDSGLIDPQAFEAGAENNLPTIEEEAARIHNEGSTLPPGTEDRIADYMASMDEDFKESAELRVSLAEAGVANGMVEYVDPMKEEKATDEQKERAAKIKARINEGTPIPEELEVSDDEIREQLDSEHAKAMVIIEKMGDGYLSFSKDEEAKLETAKVIRLKEIEEVDISKIKKRKSRSPRIDTVLKRKTKKKTFPVVLPGSGFVVNLSGLSTHEIMILLDQARLEVDDMVADSQMKWSIIHEHIEETSIGDLTFAEFMQAVSYFDFNMLVYGLLCATYPDEDKLTLTCNHCSKQYDHKYSVRSLIRAEAMSDSLLQQVDSIISASHTLDAARNVHAQAYTQETLTIKLPDSEVLVELYVQTANDFINNTVAGITEMDDPRFQQAALVSTSIRTIFVPDEEDGEVIYDEYNDFKSIVQMVYSLQDRDLVILSSEAAKMMENKDIEFGLMNVTCPHCKSYDPTLKIDISQILFQRYQAAMAMEVE